MGRSKPPFVHCLRGAVGNGARGPILAVLLAVDPCGVRHREFASPGQIVELS